MGEFFLRHSQRNEHIPYDLTAGCVKLYQQAKQQKINIMLSCYNTPLTLNINSSLGFYARVTRKVLFLPSANVIYWFESRKTKSLNTQSSSQIAEPNSLINQWKQKRSKQSYESERIHRSVVLYNNILKPNDYRLEKISVNVQDQF